VASVRASTVSSPLIPMAATSLRLISSQPRTASPRTATISWPASSPPRAAGESGSTLPITGATVVVPTTNSAQ
jgi:hypothetical protein